MTAWTPLILNRKERHKGWNHTRNLVCIVLENVTKKRDVLETIAIMLMDQKRTKPHFIDSQTIALRISAQRESFYLYIWQARNLLFKHILCL